MKKAFLDTNILIAWIFLINSLHNKSERVFELYSEFFWSTYVKKEFEEAYKDKYKNLFKLFFDLQKYFEFPEKEFYRFFDLKNYAIENIPEGKLDNAISSFKQFWEEYFGIQSQISYFNMKTAIMDCLKDLTINTNNNKQLLVNMMQLTHQRVNPYSVIDAMLESKGVHKKDRIVTLDGHDFSCFSNDSIDFVTFDDDCYNGAKNVEILCFSSIKGKCDFNVS